MAKVIETATISNDCCVEADTGRTKTGITADRSRVHLSVVADRVVNGNLIASVVMSPTAAISVAMELLKCAALSTKYGSGAARDLLLKLGFGSEA